MTMRLLWAGIAALALSACAVVPPPIAYDQPPALVPVGPGVEVVPGQPYEVFFADGWYWTHYQDHWFRSRDWHGHWGRVEEGFVPRPVTRLPRGRYRYWVGSPKAFGRRPGVPRRAVPARRRIERR
jgi:hypothetical protein